MTTRFSSNSQTSRHATVVALLAIMSLLTGCTPASGGEAETSLLPMTIVEWLFPPAADFAEADPLGVAQVSWTPMQPGENTITVTLTDLYGDPLPELIATSELAMSVRALAPDVEPQAMTLTSDGPTWTAEDIDLPEASWYQLDVRLLDRG
ncbi:MAG: hypothetical protein M3173_01870, partial [Chloroflexota bacterium]|nr:hypothetical protein [Chloroflexota bacterium]